MFSSVLLVLFVFKNRKQFSKIVNKHHLLPSKLSVFYVFCVFQINLLLSSKLSVFQKKKKKTVNQT